VGDECLKQGGVLGQRCVAEGVKHYRQPIVDVLHLLCAMKLSYPLPSALLGSNVD
jgi:hypothetical protein